MLRPMRFSAFLPSAILRMISSISTAVRVPLPSRSASLNAFITAFSKGSRVPSPSMSKLKSAMRISDFMSGCTLATIFSQEAWGNGARERGPGFVAPFVTALLASFLLAPRSRGVALL